MIIFFALFTFASFRVQRDVPDELKAGTYNFQRSMIFAIHAIAFFVICLNILSGNTDISIWSIVGFYIVQLAYLMSMTILLPRFVRLNPGLNNVMCMFLAVGFIIQTRLSFTDSARQFIIVLAGTLIFLIMCFFCKRAGFMRRLTWVYCALGLALLLMVFIMSTVTRGAKVSVEIGPFSFQPLEFVKIIFVLFVASAFNQSDSFRTVVITAVLAAFHVIIQVMCNDLGSAFILFVIYILMLYVATKKFRYILLGSAGFAAACVAAYHMFGHVRVRVSAWLNPWADIENNGWQIAQSLFAIGTGGWFGSGLFRGNPTSIPLVSRDMVISAISEEMGGIFAIFLILLCLCFTLMIFRIAIRIEMTFYKLAAFGMGVAYAIQVFLTVGGAVKFIPLTGVTLPFISSGGSSILASMIMVGIIQALYVISESDVAYERRLVAQGANISEFSGYEDLAPEDDPLPDEYYDHDYYYGDAYYQVNPEKVRRAGIDEDEFAEDNGYEDGEYEDLDHENDRYEDPDYEDGEYEDLGPYDDEEDDGSREIILKIGKDGRLYNISEAGPKNSAGRRSSGSRRRRP